MAGPKLQAEIALNTKKFTEGISRVKTTLGNMQKSFKDVTSAIAGFFVVRALTQTFASVVDYLDDIDKGSKRLSVSTVFYQQLALAAELAGASMGNLERGMRKMSQAVFGATVGNLANMKLAFQILGLEAKELAKLNTADQFMMVVKALSLMKNNTNKVAAAVTVLGRAGTQMLPLVNDIHDAMVEVNKVGIISQKHITDAAEYKDELVKLKFAFRSFIAESGAITGARHAATFLTEMSIGFAHLSDNIRFAMDEIVDHILSGSGSIATKLDQSIKAQLILQAGRVAKQEEVVDLTAEEIKKRQEAAAHLKAEGLTIQKTVENLIYQNRLLNQTMGLTGNVLALTKLELDTQRKKSQTQSDTVKGLLEEQKVLKQNAIVYKDTVAFDKRVVAIHLQNSTLSAQIQLEDKVFKLKKLQLEMQDKINKAQTDEERTLLRHQLSLKTMLMNKENATAAHSDRPDRLIANEISSIARQGGRIGHQASILDRRFKLQEANNKSVINIDKKLQNVLDYLRLNNDNARYN